ncbi:MAG: class I SAM-dependent methyltransferase [Actinobacteria bacterium]|nr:class I SAM-dependent methyltransferase [Actinomycetota bacterium]
MCKYTAYDCAPGSSHELVVDFVSPGARVLEFGPATGYMSRVLRLRGCRISGVEVSPVAAAQAREHCEDVIVGDIEALDLEAAFAGQRFDAVVFADVLEHLRDPGRVLEQIRPLLADGGRVVASIPNVAHASVRLMLMLGEFRYRRSGLLDATHLRFFTRESVRDLFEAAGYDVEEWRRAVRELDNVEVRVPGGAVPDEIRAWVLSQPEADTYQFVLRAAPSPVAAERADARRRMREEDERREREKARAAWNGRIAALGLEMAVLAGGGRRVLLLDDEVVRVALPSEIVAQPFPARDGQYSGCPADDAEAIAALERVRENGAAALVVAWPAFWWLDHYSGFRAHLSQRYPCVRRTDDLMAFDLRAVDQADPPA